jgi:hypothetical protein
LRTTTRSLAVTAAVLLALTLGGVAGSATSNAAPKKWVSVFCGSVLTWQKTVQSNTSKLDQTLNALTKSGKADLPSLRTKLVGYLDGVVRATDTLTRQVRAVGAPSVKNGAKIQSGVLGAFSRLRTVFLSAKRTAQKLPVDSAKTFSRDAVALGKRIQASANDVGAAFQALDKYSTKSLDDAAKKDASCKKLG